MAYKNRVEEKKTYKKGKWYSVDELGLFLPGNVMANMFRKPTEGERTPDGFSSGDFSDWDMCIRSFSITISILYNSEDGTDNKPA